MRRIAERISPYESTGTSVKKSESISSIRITAALDILPLRKSV
jgi:hypothetical protein